MNTTGATAEQGVLLVGASDAGKSNYLFRLWAALCAGGGALQKHQLPEDVEYLEDGVAALHRGEFAGKTPLGVHEASYIPVVGRRGAVEARGTLIASDWYGEKWQAVYRDRRWPAEWDGHLRNQCGCLVFLRATSENIEAPLDWVSLHALMGDNVNPGVAIALQGEGGDVPVPTQVMVVDWLQCIREASWDLVGSSHRPRIGLVVSAWDLVPDDSQRQLPSKYLDQNFPLLMDFLDCNPDSYDVECFGISISGCDLNEGENVVDEYLDRGVVNSGYLVHSLGGKLKRASDLSVPAAWAMGFDCAVDGK